MSYLDDDELYHYGTKRHSGRYPWGSGDNPYQHDETFLARYRELKAAGMSDTKIAEEMGLPSTYLKSKRAIATAREKRDNIARCLKMKEHGMSTIAIAAEFGKNESVIRSWLKQAEADKLYEIDKIAEVIKQNVDEKGYIDIGKGVNIDIGVNANKFNDAIALLAEDGYVTYYKQVEQLGTGHDTNIKVLCKPGTDYQDFKNAPIDSIKSIKDYFEYDENGEFVSRAPKPPVSIDSKRLQVVYNEEGGVQKDGVIELRRGVDDISLNGANYAQVRIAVDGTHYLKGMAVYADDLPEGVDIRFNTNKHIGTPVLGDGKENSVLKKLKSDPTNPFGATIKSEELDARSQRMYVDKETGELKQSAINIVNAQGDWDTWSKTLSSQFLSKQPQEVAKRQLDLDLANKAVEFEEINSLTNPTIKKHFLDEFADTCDAAAVDLKAAAFPRQAAKVILPVPSLKDNEIFAPGYSDGEEVVLVRYPHQGTFEIPTLRVNNKNKEALSVIGNAAQDAVGINHTVADRLSGADFDGDSVTIIPTKGIKITTQEPLKALEGFDPKEAYKGYPGMEVMKEANKQKQMGVVSNLITDMTLKGASPDELARATKHSLTVIDAVKHELDYRKSYEENGIAELKELYQKDEVTGKVGGASTLISKASSEVRVPERKAYPKIDPKTGEKIYEETGRLYEKEVEKYIPKSGPNKGKEVYRNKKDAYDKEVFNPETGEVEIKKYYSVEPTTTVKAMDTVKDANQLSSGLPMETIYANYANSLKRMANDARKESLATKNNPISKTAKEVYAEEIKSLDNKLMIAQSNAPRERQAQLIANQRLSEKIASNPELKDDKDKLKKLKNSELTQARASVGADKSSVLVKISPKEWDAIQAGAIGSTALKEIINNSDKDTLMQLAMPKTASTVSPAKVNKAKMMANSGHTLKEIADAIGVSPSTISKIINE